MDIRNYLQSNTVYLDGAMGTLLQERGLSFDELPERWNLSHGNAVKEIHKAYFNAGSNVVATNTFGANALKFSSAELELIVSAAIKHAKDAAKEAVGVQPKWIALDVGPSGKLLKPYGDLDFEDAVELFSQVIRLGVKYGVDLILIETMNDSLECKAAVLAAKENSNLPLFVSCAYGKDGKLMTGASPQTMVAILEGLGVDAIGVNCSVGPKEIEPIVDELLAYSSVPVFVKPNAGLPLIVDGQTQFCVSESDFAQTMKRFVEKGARMIGGCCGTTPEFIKEAVDKTCSILPAPLVKKQITCISSYTKALTFDNPVLIGERINPTGKKRFKQALIEKDVAYVLTEALAQEEKGVHALDVNVGIPDIDESIELPKYIQELQAVTDLPLQIDTSDFTALERAMRVYNGKPLVNSVSGKRESMDRVFPLVKKYGGVVVGLTLDENGIPETAEERVQIAEKIVCEAAKYGIEKKNILIDPLAMAVSADPNAASVTLCALRLIRERLGVGTSLGVSNVSFGLPNRDIVNASFFTLALENGLSAAILNPNSLEMLKSYHAYLTLKGIDKNCADYIRFASTLTDCATVLNATSTHPASEKWINDEKSPLKRAIAQGLKEKSAQECKRLLASISAQAVIEEHIVPALDEIGKAYEVKKAFLPQLLMAAEAAKAAFEQIKCSLSGEKPLTTKGKIILATVKGDIHDIGKHIVGTILENYGYSVIDLGKDVSPEKILEAVKTEKPQIVGLSALMTTTVPSMEETIRLIKNNVPNIKIMVGGAVLTREYAEKIKADGYGKDAMEAVRLADAWISETK